MAQVEQRQVRKAKHLQREESLEKLLGSARSLFVSQGYGNTTLEAISANAGLTKGSVYFYFRSKEAVLLSLIDQAEAHVVDPVIEMMKAPDTAVGRLVRFLHHQAQLGVTRREDMLLIILMSIEFTQGAVGTRMKAVYQKLYTALEAVISDGQRAGEFRISLPPRELASIVVANHDGTLVEWYRRGAELDGRKLVEALRRILVAGLQGGASPIL